MAIVNEQNQKKEVKKWQLTLKNGRKMKCIACVERLIDAFSGDYTRIEVV